ncbi:MAG: DUF2959 domain-containing protein [Phycisphaerales bacterium]
MRKPQSIIAVSLVISSAQLGTVSMTGCTSTKIWLSEKFGNEKREQLVSSVESARNAQEDAKEQFASALDEFLALTSGDQATADLESKYKQIESAYETSASRAAKVKSRIETVEAVAQALFKEWESELEEYESPKLRASSQKQLNLTRQRYDKLVGAMKEAAEKMDPVLSAFKDQTLFLKHNLNARAIASLETDLNEIRTEVASLIEEMEASIAEANEFIDSLQG